MEQRCNNPKTPNFHNYGGRGIEFRFTTVLGGSLWIQQNLGLHRKRELDRINNDGHYEPGNLRYATRSMQNLNARRTKMTEEWYEWCRTKSPYAFFTSRRLLSEMQSTEKVVESAIEAVAMKRKNWRVIRGRLIELGYTTS